MGVGWSGAGADWVKLFDGDIPQVSAALPLVNAAITKVCRIMCSIFKLLRKPWLWTFECVYLLVLNCSFINI